MNCLWKLVIFGLFFMSCSFEVLFDKPKESKELEEPIREESTEKEINILGSYSLLTHDLVNDLILEWDYDNSDGFATSFEVYMKEGSSTEWVLLGSTLIDEPHEYLINKTDLKPNTQYVFGVMSCGIDSTRSEMHSSLDDTANPDTGWALLTN